VLLRRWLCLEDQRRGTIPQAVYLESKDPAQQAEFAALSVSPEYGNTVGWQFLSGRDFSTEFASDSAGFVITESAAKLFNFDDQVGETVHWEPGWRKGGDFRIVGVIRDLVIASPFGTPMPTVFFISGYTNWINLIGLRSVPPNHCPS
jgi:hypothetical protein